MSAEGIVEGLRIARSFFPNAGFDQDNIDSHVVKTLLEIAREKPGHLEALIKIMDSHRVGIRGGEKIEHMP
jgi:hypothetical protein